MINHLVTDLNKHLNDLENLYSTVSKKKKTSCDFNSINVSCFFSSLKVSNSSDKHDLLLKQHIKQILNDLFARITNYHQQQDLTSTVVND